GMPRRSYDSVSGGQSAKPMRWRWKAWLAWRKAGRFGASLRAVCANCSASRADRLLDDAELDRAAGVEQARGGVGGERGDDVVAPAAGHQVVGRQLRERVVDALRVGVELGRQPLDVQRLPDGQGPLEDPLPELAVRRLVERALQPPEPAPEVRERRGVGAGRLPDPGEEDGVGAAGDR